MATNTDFRSIRLPSDTQGLDILEKALKKALDQNDLDEALNIYVFRFGGYRHLAWVLGEYKRGLRLTTMLVDAGGIELQGMQSVRPWLEHALFCLDTGQPKLAETKLRELLPVYKRQLARLNEIRDQLHQMSEADEKPDEDDLDEFLKEYSYFIKWLRGGEDDVWIMYEANLLQSICDALLAQGKLIVAEDIATNVVETFTSLDESKRWLHESGSNPFARRAIARYLLGKTELALADFERATITPYTRDRDRNIVVEGLHLVWQTFLLLRLGRLRQAGKVLHHCQLNRARRERPLLGAWYELALAEYFLAAQKDELAHSYVRAALTWAERCGHQETHIRARLLKARLEMRGYYNEDAQRHLQAAENAARSGGYTLLLVDTFILQSHAALLTSQLARGQAYAEEAYQLSTTQCGYRWGQGDAAHVLSELAYEQNDLTAAEHWAEEAIRIRQLLLDPKIKNTRNLLAKIQNDEAS
jgi:hypothetical protein